MYACTRLFYVQQPYFPAITTEEISPQLETKHNSITDRLYSQTVRVCRTKKEYIHKEIVSEEVCITTH